MANQRASIFRFALKERLTLEMSIKESLWWPIHIINSVDKAKLSCNTPQQTQLHSFCRKRTPFIR